MAHPAHDLFPLPAKHIRESESERGAGARDADRFEKCAADWRGAGAAGHPKAALFMFAVSFPFSGSIDAPCRLI